MSTTPRGASQTWFECRNCGRRVTGAQLPTNCPKCIGCPDCGEARWLEVADE